MEDGADADASSSRRSSSAGGGGAKKDDSFQTASELSNKAVDTTALFDDHFASAPSGEYLPLHQRLVDIGVRAHVLALECGGVVPLPRFAGHGLAYQYQAPPPRKPVVSHRPRVMCVRMFAPETKR